MAIYQRFGLIYSLSYEVKTHSFPSFFFSPFIWFGDLNEQTCFLLHKQKRNAKNEEKPGISHSVLTTYHI